ncbi:DUF5983 family protein [Klebsiella pneumoniae]
MRDLILQLSKSSIYSTKPVGILMFEFKAVCISISHMEEGDIRVLQVLSSTTNYLTCDSYLEWIHDTPYGCVIRMYDFKRHLLALKRGGVSKFLRKNLILMHREGGYLLFHFDSDADYYPGIDAVDF